MNPTYQISDSELDIMRIIWRSGNGVRFGSLVDELESMGKEWKPNTINTFLARLTEKDVLRVEKKGRINIYHAQLSEEQYLEGLTNSFVQKVFGGNTKGLIASLLRQDTLSKSDMDELRDFWEGAKSDE